MEFDCCSITTDGWTSRQCIGYMSQTTQIFTLVIVEITLYFFRISQNAVECNVVESTKSNNFKMQCDKRFTV